MNYQDHQRPRNSSGQPQFLPPAEPWILPVLSIWPEPEGHWGVLVVVREHHRQRNISPDELHCLLQDFAEDPENALWHWFVLAPPRPLAKAGKPQVQAGPLATTDQSLEDLDL